MTNLWILPLRELGVSRKSEAGPLGGDKQQGFDNYSYPRSAPNMPTRVRASLSIVYYKWIGEKSANRSGQAQTIPTIQTQIGS
jgi:hypothetical protein